MNFSNCSRNKFLAQQGLGQPQPMSTGTTICGVIFDGGLVLGADTRATAGEWIFFKCANTLFIISISDPRSSCVQTKCLGPIVADKNCEKIHYIGE